MRNDSTSRHQLFIYRVGQKVSPYGSINKSLYTQEEHYYFAGTPTQGGSILVVVCNFALLIV